MRNRLATLLLVTALASTLGACSDSGDITIKGASDSTAATQPPDPADAVPGDGQVTIPDVGDLPDLPDVSDLPGVDGALGDCIGAGAAYAAMMSSLTGSKLSADEQAKVDELRASLPAEIQDDFDVITSAMSKISEEGILAAGAAMSTPEFTTAQQNLQAFLDESCNDVSPGG